MNRDALLGAEYPLARRQVAYFEDKGYPRPSGRLRFTVPGTERRISDTCRGLSHARYSYSTTRKNNFRTGVPRVAGMHACVPCVRIPPLGLPGFRPVFVGKGTRGLTHGYVA